jgi:hypothetical protein
VASVTEHALAPTARLVIAGEARGRSWRRSTQRPGELDADGLYYDSSTTCRSTACRVVLVHCSRGAGPPSGFLGGR